jgi:hypothetical protein
MYILVLFIAGKLIFPDPRATLVQWGEYHLSWVEVLNRTDFLGGCFI